MDAEIRVNYPSSVRFGRLSANTSEIASLLLLFRVSMTQCKFHFLPGFNAYVGYLLLEHTHANPVLVTFCRLLIKTFNDRQASENGKCSAETNHLVHDNPCCTSKFPLNSLMSRKQSKVGVRAKWPIQPELIPGSIALSSCSLDRVLVHRRLTPPPPPSLRQ